MIFDVKRSVEDDCLIRYYIHPIDDLVFFPNNLRQMFLSSLSLGLTEMHWLQDKEALDWCLCYHCPPSPDLTLLDLFGFFVGFLLICLFLLIVPSSPQLLTLFLCQIVS